MINETIGYKHEDITLVYITSFKPTPEAKPIKPQVNPQTQPYDRRGPSSKASSNTSIPLRRQTTNMPPSPHTSPPPALLPSPFTHSDEAIDKSPTFRGSSIPPPPIEATTASIYDPEPPPRTRADAEEEEAEADEEDDYPPLAGEDGEGGASLLPPPELHPFFTLITDAATGETYHPHTYYIFSDDDPDVLTSASLQALDSYSPQSPLLKPHGAKVEGQDAPSQQPPERFVLLDLSNTGTAVESATSLSPAWAVTDVIIRGAPTFQDEAVGSEGLMLVVEGLGSQQRVEETGKAKDKMEEARKKCGGSLLMGMEELRVGMEGGLDVLDKIVGVD